MTDVPETPEGVALVLLQMILAASAGIASDNNPTKAEIFRLYRECFCAALGEWDIGRLLH